MNFVRLKRVLDQLLGKFKALRANRTRVGHALVRFESVLLQLILPRVRQIALVARVRLLAGVSANVALENFGRVEALWAVGTRVALLGRPGAVLEFNVPDEAVRVVEAGRTELALLVARVQVDQHVVGQTRLVDKVDAAEVALEAARRGEVQPPVVAHRQPRFELHAANVAHGRHLRVPVIFAVRVQLLRGGKCAPAGAALPSANRAGER
jgi:hypothetical protein